MMSTAPLGSLAEVILELHGELIDEAFARAAAKRSPLADREGGTLPSNLTIVRFRVDELASQHIQAGNWVAVGVIQEASAMAMIEFNLSTFESREVFKTLDTGNGIPASTIDRSDGSADLRQAAS
jgi:hypothetical protein